MPIALIEAGMLGLLEAASNEEPTSEIVTNDKNGLVNETNTWYLADKLGNLIQSLEIRAQYSENTRTFTTSNFSPKNELDTLLQNYEIVVGLR